MDKPAQEADAAAVDRQWLARIGAVLRAELEERDVSQRAFAAAVGMNDGHLSRVIGGQVPGLPLAAVLGFERALGLPAGAILVRAGLVAAPSTVRSLIEVDPDLPPRERDVVLDTYDAARKRASSARSIRRSSK